VTIHRDARNRPFGFVQFEEIECALSALKYLQNMTLFGRKMRIEQGKIQPFM
jgi:RNA recognition motif-containing protein